MSNLIFETEGRKAKLSQFIFTELFCDDVADLVLSSEINITSSHSCPRQKALPAGVRQNTS